MSLARAPSSDRSTDSGLAREVEERLHPQRKLLAELMHSRALADGDIAHALQQLTEVAARALRVERASVWRICEDQLGPHIECGDLFEAGPHRHSTGVVVREREAPRYFAALASERAIAAHDAMTDE